MQYENWQLIQPIKIFNMRALHPISVQCELSSFFRQRQSFDRHSFDGGLLWDFRKKINVTQSKFFLKILFMIKSFQMKTNKFFV